MNYIELINAIWELREQGIISVHEHDFYNYLLHKCNKLNWKNPFNQSTEIVCAVLGISRNSLINRRNRLQQLGLIEFKEGVAKGKPAEYTLIRIKKDTLEATPDDTLPPTVSYTLDCTLPYTYTKNKTKKDKTKQKEKIEKEIFSKPALSEITDYCRKRKNDIDPQLFFDFYEAKGWMIGKNGMKDWQAAVRTWENKQTVDKHNFVKHNKDKHYEIF